MQLTALTQTNTLSLSFMGEISPERRIKIWKMKVIVEVFNCQR
jgi:hypothetical protein